MECLLCVQKFPPGITLIMAVLYAILYYFGRGITKLRRKIRIVNKNTFDTALSHCLSFLEYYIISSLAVIESEHCEKSFGIFFASHDVLLSNKGKWKRWIAIWHDYNKLTK